MEALFDEVSVEAIHDLVLAGLVEFEDLYRAARTWRVMDGRNIPWIKEMADFSLARPAGFNSSSARYAARPLNGVLVAVRRWWFITITVTVTI